MLLQHWSTRSFVRAVITIIFLYSGVFMKKNNRTSGDYKHSTVETAERTDVTFTLFPFPALDQSHLNMSEWEAKSKFLRKQYENWVIFDANNPVPSRSLRILVKKDTTLVTYVDLYPTLSRQTETFAGRSPPGD